MFLYIAKLAVIEIIIYFICLDDILSNIINWDSESWNRQ